MATQLDLLMASKDRTHLERVWQRIERRVVELELMMSRFSQFGELYRVNQSAHEGFVELSVELWGVVERSFAFGRLSGGSFDIALGRSSFVEVDPASRSLRFKSGGVYLDLGGVGKGYALDVIGDILNEEGVENAFVNFGNSSILARGEHPTSSAWGISLKDPYSGGEGHSFTLRNSTLSVSGNSPRRESHIIDPITGMPYTSKEMLAIHASSAFEAEMLSTCGVVMGRERFEKFIEQVELIEYIFFSKQYE